jgi:hypothetical protein
MRWSHVEARVPRYGDCRAPLAACCRSPVHLCAAFPILTLTHFSLFPVMHDRRWCRRTSMLPLVVATKSTAATATTYPIAQTCTVDCCS